MVWCYKQRIYWGSTDLVVLCTPFCEKALSLSGSYNSHKHFLNSYRTYDPSHYSPNGAVSVLLSVPNGALWILLPNSCCANRTWCHPERHNFLPSRSESETLLIVHFSQQSKK